MCIRDSLEGVHVGVDFKKALFWLTRASKKNLPMAHFCIGVIYYEGLGVGYDFNISIKAFKKSIEFGIGDEPGYSGWNGIIAETFIGEMYFLGGNGAYQGAPRFYRDGFSDDRPYYFRNGI